MVSKIKIVMFIHETLSYLVGDNLLNYKHVSYFGHIRIFLVEYKVVYN